MTGAQVRDARHLLGWTRLGLATRSGLHERTIQTYEDTGRMPKPMYRRTNPEDRLGILRATLEAAGIEFTSGDVPEAKLHREDP